MDLQMPICDGLEATALIRKMDDIVQPYICALTANAMEGDQEVCLAARMNNYISKPLTLDRLMHVLQVSYQYSQSFSSHVSQ